MAISNAVERDGFVYVYDENGRNTAAIGVGVGIRADDGLKDYTTSSVNIKKDGWIYVYDENGNQINAVPT